MPERHERRLQWRVGRPLTIGAVTVLPVEQVLLHTRAGPGGSWITASKEAVAIVVRDRMRCHALAANGGPMSLDALRDRVAGLDAWLAST